jgi:hypothetical protein
MLNLIGEGKTSLFYMEIGDKVRIINRDKDNITGSCDWMLPNGDVGKIGYITRVFTKGDYIYRVSINIDNPQETGSYLGGFNAKDLELVNDSEIEEYKLIEEYPGSAPLGTITTLKNGKCVGTKPQGWCLANTSLYNNTKFFEKVVREKFKVGDYVVIGAGKNQIRQISNIYYDSYYPFTFTNDGAWGNDGIRLATQEEILEYLIKKSDLNVDDKVECLYNRAESYNIDGENSGNVHALGTSKGVIKKFVLINNELCFQLEWDTTIYLKASDFKKYTSVKVGEYTANLVDGKIKIGCQTYTKEDLYAVRRAIKINDGYEVVIRGIHVTIDLLNKLEELFKA